MNFWKTRVWLAAALILALLPSTGLAQTAPAPLGCLPGPEAVDPGDPFCAGAIDAPLDGSRLPVDKPFVVSGWMLDTTAQGWAGYDAVHVYQGKAGEGGKFLALATGRGRPDVAAALGNPNGEASGFQAIVPQNLLPVGPTTLTVYAHSPGKGWWYKQISVTIQRPFFAQPVLVVQTPKGGQDLKFGQDYPITGYTLDPGARDDTGVELVEVYIYAERGGGGAIRVGVATVGDPNDDARQAYGARFANTGWTLNFRTTDYHTGNATLYIYGRSTYTAGETLQKVDINIVNK